MPAQETLPIFPLNTVLFPGGTLPLKIFEQRYLDMSTSCLRYNRPFGVCLIKEGNEVGVPAAHEPVGCTAAITEWDMQQLGVLHLRAEGVQRFRILNRQVAKNGLISAEVEMLAADQQTPLSPELRVCATVLKLVMEKIGVEQFPPPFKLDDATWVSYRLAEMLPLKLAAKQEILEIDDPVSRLRLIRKFLVQQGLLS